MDNNNNNVNKNNIIINSNSTNSINGAEEECIEMNDTLPLVNGKPENQIPKRKWLDIYIVFFTLFLSEAARGLVLPTISLYVIAVGGDTSFLGVVVSGFSLGRFISTILLGYLSGTFKYKGVFSGSVFICIIGSAFYCGLYQVSSKWILLLSRFLLGVGAGTLSVVRSYVAEITTTEERTKFVAITGAVQYLGFAITPSIGSTLAYIPLFNVGPFPINPMTTPGWLLLIGNISLVILLLFMFKNPKDKSSPTTPPPPKTMTTIVTTTTITTTAVASGEKLTRSQSITSQPVEEKKKSTFSIIFNDRETCKSLLVFITINFFIRAVLGIFETLGTPIYTLLNDDIDNTSGYFFGAIGCIGVVVLIGIGYVSRKGVNDFYILILGNIIMVIGCLVVMANHLNWGRFIVSSILIWGFGFPLAQTVVVSMFSKTLSASIGKSSQGTLMGIIGAAGSLGRIAGPYCSGLIYSSDGTLFTFLFASALSVISLIISFIVIPIDIKIVMINKIKRSFNCLF